MTHNIDHTSDKEEDLSPPLGVHWVAVTNFGCKTDEIILLDSNIRVYGKGRNRRAWVNAHIQEQICNLMNTESKHITIHIQRVQQHINGFDCRLFAVANI